MSKILPFPRGPLGPNPANDKVPRADEHVTRRQHDEAHRDAVHAGVKRQRLIGLRNAADVARVKGDSERAMELNAEAAEVAKELGP